MKILVTGSGGFIGRNLTDMLSAHNHIVACYDAADGFDVLDMAALASRIAGMDSVIHLAAVSTVKGCEADRARAVEVNVGGTSNVIAASATAGVRHFVLASTEWVYGDNHGVSHEESPLAPENLYAETKVAAEKILTTAASSFSAATILRFGITYGPRKTGWTAVESLVHDVMTKDAVMVGNFASARRFIHVSDLCRGIMGTIRQGGIYNIVGGELLTMNRIVAAAQRALGVEFTFSDRGEEASVRDPSPYKVARQLGFSSRITIDKGIEDIIAYFRRQT